MWTISRQMLGDAREGLLPGTFSKLIDWGVWCAVCFWPEEGPVVYHPFPAHRHDWSRHCVLRHWRCVLATVLLECMCL